MTDAERISNGEDFGEIAKLMSDDPGSANSGGDMGWSDPGTFVPEFDFFTTRDRSNYTADQDIIRGMLRAKISHGWTAGLSGVATRNRGTLPMDWDRYQAWVRWNSPWGVFVRLQAERYSLRENNPYAGLPDAPAPDVNDYDADLLTVALGYSF